MSTASQSLSLQHEAGRHVDLLGAGGRLLMRYIYDPDTPASESRRPFAHPVCSTAGDVLTNFRPSDHPWHHALSMTLTSVDGVNFWGGPSYRAEDGYQPREPHGQQVHRAWETLEPGHWVERLDWRDGSSGRTLLDERRIFEARLEARSWSLRWISELTNVAGWELALGNYHSTGGLKGSHYTGLQFRGARDLLDEHGDATIGITADGDLRGEAAVHGARGRWMEWSCQHDGSLRRTRVRFEFVGEPLPWFVRQKNPLAAFAFHDSRSHALAMGATLRLEHLLTFTSV